MIETSEQYEQRVRRSNRRWGFFGMAVIFVTVVSLFNAVLNYLTWPEDYESFTMDGETYQQTDGPKLSPEYLRSYLRAERVCIAHHLNQGHEVLHEGVVDIIESGHDLFVTLYRQDHGERYCMVNVHGRVIHSS